MYPPLKDFFPMSKSLHIHSKIYFSISDYHGSYSLYITPVFTKNITSKCIHPNSQINLQPPPSSHSQSHESHPTPFNNPEAPSPKEKPAPQHYDADNSTPPPPPAPSSSPTASPADIPTSVSQKPSADAHG